MKNYLSQVASAGLAATMALAVQSSAQAYDFDFTSGDGGFVSSGSPDWTYTGSQWQTNGQNNGENFLTSPLLTSDVDGEISISITHALSFEEPSDYLDGGIVEYSINGGAFEYFDSSDLYPATPLDGVDELEFVEGFGGISSSRTDSGQDGILNNGDTFQIRLHAAWDSSILESDPAWAISSISISDATPVPFGVSTDLSILILGGLYGASHIRKKLAARKQISNQEA